MRCKQHYSKRSVFTGLTNVMEIELDLDDYALWRSGKPIQLAMPYLTAEEREFLMTGVTPKEWEAVFGKERY